MLNKNKLLLVILFACGVLLSSCGGGGGSPASPNIGPGSVSSSNPATPSLVGKPLQITASDSIFTGYVEITWNVPYADLAYDIYRADTLNGQKSYVGTATTGTAVYNDTSAVAGTTYFYWVESFDTKTLKRSALAGGDAGTRAAMPTTPILLAPSNVQASDNTSTTGVVITWNASTNATQYIISRSATSVYNASTQIAARNATLLTYTDLNAVAGVVYWYWVVARDSTTTAVSAPNAGARLAMAPVMTPPANIVASTSIVASIQVLWDTVPGAASYKVYRKMSSTAARAMLLQTGVTMNAFTDSTVTTGTRYYYLVVAVDANAVAGAISGDSNAGVSLAPNITGPTLATVYPTYDNALVGDTYGSNNNTVFHQSELMLGCNYLAGITFSSMICGRSLVYFKVPAINGKRIISATLRVYPSVLPLNTANVLYEAHPVASSWNTFQVTYATAPQYYTTPVAYANPPTSTVTPLDFNVIQIVQGWANGAANLGFYLFANSSTFSPTRDTYEMTSFDSMEVYNNVARRPQLIINYQ